MPFVSHPKKQTHSINGSFWERIWIFPLLVNVKLPTWFPEDPNAKGAERVLGYLFMVSLAPYSVIIYATADGVCGGRFSHAVGTNGFL